MLSASFYLGGPCPELDLSYSFGSASDPGHHIASSSSGYVCLRQDWRDVATEQLIESFESPGEFVWRGLRALGCCTAGLTACCSAWSQIQAQGARQIPRSWCQLLQYGNLIAPNDNLRNWLHQPSHRSSFCLKLLPGTSLSPAVRDSSASPLPFASISCHPNASYSSSKWPATAQGATPYHSSLPNSSPR